MPSTDPWYDWYVTYGSLPPFPLPPDLLHFTQQGRQITKDENGDPVIPWPFPQFPPSVPECVSEWQQQTKASLLNSYFSATRTCPNAPLFFGWVPIATRGSPPEHYHYYLEPDVFYDPCSSGRIIYPSDCPYLDEFLSGWNLADCPNDYELSPIVQPALHRIVQEILRPSGKPFLFRVGYDNGLVALLFDWEVLGEGDCAAYATGIGLQIEALMNECNQIITTDYKVLLQAVPYFDGILWGVKFKIIALDTQNTSYAIIGYNRLLERGFCNRQRIFRDNVGTSSCEKEDEDMGCECEQIEQIIQTKIDQIKDEYLDPIKEKTNFLHDLFEPIQQQIKSFWGSGRESWDRFLQIFSYCWAYIRPSGTDDDEIILPSLSDRIKDNFERVKSRQRTIYSTIPRLMRVTVRPDIIGERNTSRDTHIIGQRNVPQIVPYNHYGQIWLEVAYSSGRIITTSWRWIRSRDQTIVYWLPDQRVGETDVVTITPRYQLFPDLRMTSVTTELALQPFADLTSPIWVPEQDQRPNNN